MSKADESTNNNHVETPPTTATPSVDVENSTSRAGLGVSAITRRWKRDDLLKKGSLVARGLALLFSFLSFIIMASNKHGDGINFDIDNDYVGVYELNFDKYEEYRYLLAIAILSTLYTGAQAFRHVTATWKWKMIFEQRVFAIVDFLGDQVMAYLLISSASAAIPLTNKMRKGEDNSFTGSSAAAICMSFFAFISLAISAIVSGYKLSTQSYI